MKAKFGAIVVSGSGKIGGHVASKNKSGAYFRTKTTPTNPATTTQVAARAILTQLSQAWRGLTAPQRAAWNNAVANFQGTNIFGDVISPSGINLYVKLNTNILVSGGAVVTTPPAPTASPAYVTLTPTAAAGAGTLSIAFAATPVPANVAYVIEATPQVSPGISNVKNKYRVLAVLAPAAASPYNGFAAYTAKFGSLVAGQVIGFRVKAVSKTTGIVSQDTSVLITVAA